MSKALSSRVWVETVREFAPLSQLVRFFKNRSGANLCSRAPEAQKIASDGQRGGFIKRSLEDADQGMHLCQLASVPSNRSCDLLLKAIRGVTIALVSSLERKRWQPGLAADGPELVGWRQLVRGIKGSEIHFDFVCAA